MSTQPSEPGVQTPGARTQPDRLQIRVVPYSPPRLSSDYSGSLHTEALLATPSPGYSPGSQNHGTVSPAASEPNVITFDRDVSPISPGPSFAERKRTMSSHTRPSTASSTSSMRRQRRTISVHPDKTFSVLPHDESISSRTVSSNLTFASTLGSGSQPRVSSGPFSQDVYSAAFYEASLSSQDTQQPISPHLNEGTTMNSPWGEKFVGGMRKVAASSPVLSQASQDSPIQRPQRVSLPVVDQSDKENWTMSGALRSKSSFNSSVSGSILSDRTNIRVYAPRTPRTKRQHEQASVIRDNSTPMTMDSNTNFCIIGESGSSHASFDDQSRPRTEDSEPNLVRYGSRSTMASEKGSRLRQEYSRESLVVPPLRPVRKPLPESHTQGSSSATISSGSGFLSVWSAMLNRETARALFGGRIETPSNQSARTVSNTSTLDPRMAVLQHQWAGPLSTVFSESEGTSARLSRSLSPFSEMTADLDNSLLHNTISEDNAYMATLNEDVEYPAPAMTKPPTRDSSVSGYKLIGDQDEHGDGLTDLRELVYHKPGRGRFPTLVTGNSDRGVWSSSSITNGINYWAIPAWARLYYGSGERKFLRNQISQESIQSLSNDSALGAPDIWKTLSTERQAALLSGVRRPDQPVEGNRLVHKLSHSDMGWIRTLKKQTSSLWSPHLKQDKRASNYSIWQPPLGVVSFEGRAVSLRNLQVILFMSGFIFPPAWILAAILPLPSLPQVHEKELQSTSSLDVSFAAANHLEAKIDPSLYDRTKWWRDLNRVMAMVGMLVICVFIILIVIGAKQKWH